MGCCNEARKSERSRFASVTTELEQPKQYGVTLRYIGLSAIIVRGPRTGQSYTFQVGDTDYLIDSRDAEVLLRTGLFIYARNNRGAGSEPSRRR